MESTGSYNVNIDGTGQKILMVKRKKPLGYKLNWLISSFFFSEYGNSMCLKDSRLHLLCKIPKIFLNLILKTEIMYIESLG